MAHYTSSLIQRGMGVGKCNGSLLIATVRLSCQGRGVRWQAVWLAEEQRQCTRKERNFVNLAATTERQFIVEMPKKEEAIKKVTSTIPAPPPQCDLRKFVFRNIKVILIFVSHFSSSGFPTRSS